MGACGLICFRTCSSAGWRAIAGMPVCVPERVRRQHIPLPDPFRAGLPLVDVDSCPCGRGLGLSIRAPTDVMVGTNVFRLFPIFANDECSPHVSPAGSDTSALNTSESSGARSRAGLRRVSSGPIKRPKRVKPERIPLAPPSCFSSLFFLSSQLSRLSSLAQRPSPEARKASLPTLPKGG